MAKKSRRKKRRQIRLSATQLVQPGATEATVEPIAAVSTAKASDWREGYGYVVADLKRVGVIAAATLAVVIALVLVLTQAVG
jgi:ribosomal protein L13E